MDATDHSQDCAARARALRCLTPAALLALAACTQNTGGAAHANVVKAPENENVGLAFDPDDDLPATPELEFEFEPETGLVGALIPVVEGSPERRVAFFAFATDEPAENLDRVHLSAPSDLNGVADVFLAAVADTRIEVGGVPRPSIFAQAMVDTFSHPRCINCHSFHYAGGFGASGTTHPGGASQQDNKQCTDCHDKDIGPDEQGGAIDWHAPLQAVNGNIDFRGKSPLELCEQVKANVPDPLDHFSNDSKIFWAFEDALLPTGLEATGGAAPFRKTDFDDLVKAWVQGDCQCLTRSAVRDVALVSFSSGGTAAADGASRRPSLAFVQNTNFDPSDPLATNPAGWVFVAFESSADNLAAGFADHNGGDPDVWRARVAVNVDVDGAGVLTPGAIDLVAEPSQIELASASVAGALSGANGSANHPAISASGDFVAFESTAIAGQNQLVANFVDGNGDFEPDVYVCNVETSTTALVSRVLDNQGGNAASSRPAIAPRGNAVAFETLASDLVFEDNDQERDVYWATVNTNSTVVLALYRASVRSGDVPAGPGESLHASVFVDPDSGRVSVVYESAKADLAATSPQLPARNVYLTTGPEPIVTTLISQRVTLAGAALADGDSTAPSISPDGRWVVYQTAATNLDTVWTEDTNGSLDVILLDLAQIESDGLIEGRRLSVAAEGLSGNGEALGPLIAGVKVEGVSTFEALPLCGYRTLADNLGGKSKATTEGATTELVFTNQ